MKPREFGMRRIDSHLLGIDNGSELLFSHHEDGGLMWTGKGDREVRRAIRFSKRFRSLPAVIVNITLWDMDRSRNQRGDLCAENVTDAGFDLVFRTWADTKVARIRVDWTALGEIDHPEDEAWGAY
jgi:hypothetical protein